eukprot:TRINITY_DN6422_c1_g1_i1.p1 TRINITY_DN6422_c1_g1~~TRINITY_DN6422_c1_g1_i1.p1  ORF type:complete len:950 (+),score=194.16 TRINITY_DN6422_c1_g1_i1:57-2906(+)
MSGSEESFTLSSGGDREEAEEDEEFCIDAAQEDYHLEASKIQAWWVSGVKQRERKRRHTEEVEQSKRAELSYAQQMIARAWRRHTARGRQKITSAALCIQKAWRRHTAKAQQKITSAALCIQKAWRRHIAKAQQKITSAALCIQKQFRWFISRRATAARTIQHYYRAYKEARARRAAVEKARKLEKAASVDQELHNAAGRVQRWYRSKRDSSVVEHKRVRFQESQDNSARKSEEQEKETAAKLITSTWSHHRTRRGIHRAANAKSIQKSARTTLASLSTRNRRVHGLSRDEDVSRDLLTRLEAHTRHGVYSTARKELGKFWHWALVEPPPDGALLPQPEENSCLAPALLLKPTPQWIQLSSIPRVNYYISQANACRSALRKGKLAAGKLARTIHREKAVKEARRLPVKAFETAKALQRIAKAFRVRLLLGITVYTNKKATVMQCAWRSYKARCAHIEKTVEKEYQKAAERAEVEFYSACLLQRFFSTCRAKAAVKRLRIKEAILRCLDSKEEADVLRAHDLLTVQRCLRGFKTRQALHQTYDKAWQWRLQVLAQCTQYKLAVRRVSCIVYKKASAMQRAWKCYSAVRERRWLAKVRDGSARDAEHQQKFADALQVVQNWFRVCLACKETHGTRLTRRLQNLQEEINEVTWISAVTIQCAFRSYVARSRARQALGKQLAIRKQELQVKLDALKTLFEAPKPTTTTVNHQSLPHDTSISSNIIAALCSAMASWAVVKVKCNPQAVLKAQYVGDTKTNRIRREIAQSTRKYAEEEAATPQTPPEQKTSLRTMEKLRWTTTEASSQGNSMERPSKMRKKKLPAKSPYLTPVLKAGKKKTRCASRPTNDGVVLPNATEKYNADISKALSDKVVEHFFTPAKKKRPPPSMVLYQPLKAPSHTLLTLGNVVDSVSPILLSPATGNTGMSPQGSLPSGSAVHAARTRLMEAYNRQVW